MPTEPILPKPTVYQGTTFRSRMEARWAVILDFTKNVISWEYEPLTIRITPENWDYTPDFLVKLFDRQGNRREIYLECKPAAISEGEVWTFKRASYFLKYPLMLVECGFYFQKGDLVTMYGTNFWKGNDSPCFVDEVLVNVRDAHLTACNYRFDLC